MCAAVARLQADMDAVQELVAVGSVDQLADSAAAEIATTLALVADAASATAAVPLGRVADVGYGQVEGFVSTGAW